MTSRKNSTLIIAAILVGLSAGIGAVFAKVDLAEEYAKIDSKVKVSDADKPIQHSETKTEIIKMVKGPACQINADCPSPKPGMRADCIEGICRFSYIKIPVKPNNDYSNVKCGTKEATDAKCGAMQKKCLEKECSMVKDMVKDMIIK